MKRLLISVFSFTLFAGNASSMESPEEQAPLGARLIEACNIQDLVRVKALIDAGADVNYVPLRKDEDDPAPRKEWSALMMAVFRTNRSICELLINAGADVNYEDWREDTALIRAAHQQQKDLVQLLIAAKVNVHHVSRQGFSALWWAMYWENQEISELLVEAMLEPAQIQKQRVYALLNCFQRNFPRGDYRNLCHVFKNTLLASIKEKREHVRRAISDKKDFKLKQDLLEKYFPNNPDGKQQ